MKLLMLMIAAALVMIVLLFQPAYAQLLCDDRSSIVASLAKDYKEHQSAIGLPGGANGPNGRVLELWTSDNTYTILIVLPPLAGQPTEACFMSTGYDWQNILKKKGEPM